MKKLLLSIAAFALVATTMTSCKKEYTCECTVDFFGVKTTTSGVIKDTKKNAKESCEKNNSALVMCKIK